MMLANESVADAKRRLNNQIYENTGGVVQSGPFQGMKIIRERGWDDGNIGTQLLGCYEQELHDVIEAEIARLSVMPSPKVVDIGCAEGYYAVGLARRLPKATVVVVEKDEYTLSIAGQAAIDNGVIDRIALADIDVTLAQADFVVCDCEGAEAVYLDLERFPSLRQATILVECHYYNDEPTSKLLIDRFETTHDIRVILEGPRNPNASHMVNWHSHDRWLAVSEGRPALMGWLYMRPLVPLMSGKTCGECTLCCKLEMVKEDAIDKRRGEWCKECAVGVGCKIYETRPKSCRMFSCMWLTSDMPDELRPDKVGMYVIRRTMQAPFAKVSVDPERPDTWREGPGKEIVDKVIGCGIHAIVVTGNQVNFIKGEGQPMPERIFLDWLL